MRRKKPDLIVVLAVLIGFGVLATEVTYGGVFSTKSEKTVTTQQ